MNGWLDGYGYAGWKAGVPPGGERTTDNEVTEEQPAAAEAEKAKRAEAARKKLIAAQDKARQEPAFQPIVPLGKSYCNQATAQIAAEVGAPMDVFLDESGNPRLANEIARNLASSKGYRKVSPAEAQRIANEGGFAVAAYENPSGGSGHVATVRPEGVEGDTPVGVTGPLLNNIGKQVGVARQSGAFSKEKKVEYYVPVQ